MFAALAVALVLQDTPADFLKKVEEKYAAAKSLSMTADAKGSKSGAGRTTEGTFSGSFRSKGEGMAFVEFTGKLGAEEIPRTTLISDAKRFKCAAGGVPTVRDHSQPIGSIARRGFVRAGLFGMAGSLVAWALQPEAVSLDKLFEVSKVADGGTEKVGERECRIVTFTLTSSVQGLRTTRCKLWIDPAQLVILKRESATDSPGEAGSVTETYAGAVFDAEIADDVFKIP